MKYLLEKDIILFISEQSLDQITTNQNIIDYAETIALDEASSYIVSRFDTDFMFRPYAGWTSSATYSINQRVLYQDNLYLTKQNNAPGTQINNTSFFDKKDDRSQLINMCIIDIMIYHLLTTLDYQTVGDFRHTRYLEAVKKLKDYCKGTTTLPNAVLRDNQEGISIMWGSKYADNFDINQVISSNRYDLDADVFSSNPNYNPYLGTGQIGGGSGGGGSQAGPQGPQGEMGPQGPQGISGATGPQGISGATGPQGISGATGPQGINGVTGPQGPIGATGGFSSFGSTILNLTMPIVSSSQSTTFSSLIPQTLTGIWYNESNNQYYIGGGVQPAYIERRSATFSLVSRHALSNNPNFLVSQMAGSTASDTLIAWYGPGNPVFGIFQASNMRQITTFTPTSGSASGAFDVDFANRLLYTSVAANGLTYVWNLGSTFSGPFTLQATLSGQNAGVYCKVDEARNRLIISSNGAALNFYYLNAVGTFSQYALETQLLTNNFTNATPGTSAINFDNNFYYWVIPNYGIFVLDRISLNMRGYIPITSAGNVSNQATFLGTDSVNRRLLIRWSSLVKHVEIKSTDTTNGFNIY